MITLHTFNRDVPVVRRVGIIARAVDNLSGHARSVPVDEGCALARSAFLGMLAVIRGQLGSLDRVSRIVELHGSPNATPEFEEHARVLDGVSDLSAAVFGPAGAHARSVVGVGSLRKGVPLTIKAIVEARRA